MDLTFSAEDRAFRAEVRDWLHDHKPKEERPHSGTAMRDFDCAWQRTQYDAGYAGIALPCEYGGRGASLTRQLIWHEEYARARAPYVGCMFPGVNQAAPTIIVKGTDAQKQRYLPPILKGQVVWCQGFSEPGAGSDLASLHTHAEIDGDDLVVNGTKIWTSHAPVADYQKLLVRTDRTAPKHKGLSWLICDLKTPGVRIDPIRTMAGEWHFAQIFYDNVRIPLSNVVGAINDGWNVAMTTLGFERGTAFIVDQVELANILEELIDLSRCTLGRPGAKRAIDNDDIALRLAQLRAEVAALRAMAYMAISRAAASGVPGPEASITRLFFSEVQRRMRRLSLDILNADCLALQSADSWPERYLNGFRHTIAAGTSEIQRNIIGERVLGLPRK
jgi:alkylation response protein AidB-like acyl-CoA dehydrogenase